MNTKELFLRAREICPMEQVEFLGYLGDSVRALLACAGDGSIAAPETVDEECGLDPLYDGALIAGAVAGKSGKSEDEARFLREAEEAFRAAWRRAARGKRLAVRGW